MPRAWDQVAALVRSRICAVCVPGEGSCAEQPRGGCALFDLFPLVVQAIVASESQELADYRRAIRENVCSACVDAALDGSCEARARGRCAVDLYLAGIVEAVRQAGAADALVRPGAGGLSGEP
jgi:hypothetical protein